MHDTAFRIGTLAMNIYADLKNASILEVGSQAVNGSLRDSALPTTRYVGVDVEDGEGVDIVVEPGKPLPVEDESFDLVMATSVFEHDACFWMTFLEMCRAAKDGGYIYINTPSNGVVHRYPQDNWRFYPDSGQALVQWATSQGHFIALVESFVADREDDIWNDFVAVFRKGRITKALPKVSLHEHVPCSNVASWKSKKIINPREEPEDMVLLREARQRAQQADEKLGEAARQCDSLIEEAGNVRSELARRESELLQRQEEVEQTRSELAQTRFERDGIRDRLSTAEQRLDLEATLRCEAEATLEKWKSLHERAQAQVAELSADLAEARRINDRLERELSEAEADHDKLQAEATAKDRRIEDLSRALTVAENRCSEHEERSRAHFEETAALSRLLLNSEQQSLKEIEKLRRIRELFSVLARRPRWWAILPRPHQSRLEHRKLRRLGLFDDQSYLWKNPDVAASGMDPLKHFIIHGIDEDRQF